MDYPTSFQAVDLIIRKNKLFLFGRKAGKDKFQCIGGFVDPKDPSLEFAARREQLEEAGFGLECSFPEYRFSFRVNDERYANSEHNRDTQRFAIKSSAQKRNGVWRDVFKNPSDKSKSSKRGILGLYRNSLGEFYTSVEDASKCENYLKPVFRNGELLIDQNLNEIRKRAGLIL